MRFLHTGDWQLGMTRHFLSPEAQARFSHDRTESVRALLALAHERACEFVVVCGDVFETNQVSRSTVIRALDALATSRVPVYLLPGNHDPLDAGSIYRSPTFVEKKPAHVHVLDDTTPRVVRPGVEVVGAPWTSKRPLVDLCASAVENLEASAGTLRVLVGHGALDVIAPNADNPALVRLANAEAVIAAGKVHYVALGDRHSSSSFGGEGRVRYAGAPEATDYDELKPGHVLVVDLERDTLRVEEKRVGRWNFVALRAELSTDSDLDALQAQLASFTDKERTIVKLTLVGTITLAQEARLSESILAPMREIFGAIENWERHTDLVVRSGDADFESIALSGFAANALAKLRAASEASDATTRESAEDALALLLRLARRRT